MPMPIDFEGSETIEIVEIEKLRLIGTFPANERVKRIKKVGEEPVAFVSEPLNSAAVDPISAPIGQLFQNNLDEVVKKVAGFSSKARIKYLADLLENVWDVFYALQDLYYKHKVRTALVITGSIIGGAIIGAVLIALIAYFFPAFFVGVSIPALMFGTGIMGATTFGAIGKWFSQKIKRDKHFDMPKRYIDKLEKEFNFNDNNKTVRLIQAYSYNRSKDKGITREDKFNWRTIHRKWISEADVTSTKLIPFLFCNELIALTITKNSSGGSLEKLENDIMAITYILEKLLSSGKFEEKANKAMNETLNTVKKYNEENGDGTMHDKLRALIQVNENRLTNGATEFFVHRDKIDGSNRSVLFSILVEQVNRGFLPSKESNNREVEIIIMSGGNKKLAIQLMVECLKAKLEPKLAPEDNFSELVQNEIKKEALKRLTTVTNEQKKKKHVRRAARPRA